MTVRRGMAPRRVSGGVPPTARIRCLTRTSRSQARHCALQPPTRPSVELPRQRPCRRQRYRHARHARQRARPAAPIRPRTDCPVTGVPKHAASSPGIRQAAEPARTPLGARQTGLRSPPGTITQQRRPPGACDAGRRPLRNMPLGQAPDARHGSIHAGINAEHIIGPGQRQQPPHHRLQPSQPNVARSLPGERPNPQQSAQRGAVHEVKRRQVDNNDALARRQRRDRRRSVR